MFVPNRIPNQFARWPEMTCPLSAEIGPIEEEWDTQSLLGVPSAFLSFCCTDELASILWLGVALTGRPSIIKKILFTATSREIPNHKKRTKKKTRANNSVKKLLDRGSYEKLQNACYNPFFFFNLTWNTARLHFVQYPLDKPLSSG